MNLYINDETSRLKKVILGIGNSFGGTPALEDTYDPKSKEYILKGKFPIEKDIVSEMEAFAAVLVKHGVEVIRPDVIENYNQVFARDISFVIDDKFIKTNMIEDRAREIEAIHSVTDQLKPEQILIPPIDAKIEGGDVMPWKEFLIVGYSKEPDFSNYTVSRTNEAGVEFLRKSFPHKKIRAFELNKSDVEPRDNALHLDCCFQPVNKHKAILYKGGFKNIEDYERIVNYFGEENIFEITREEMYNMNSNVFSISPDVVVSEKNFVRLNNHMRNKWGMTVEEVPYAEISKMEGLLRCSTMPLERETK
ncbi:MAG: amidinotransferase [Flavobacteriales bacterium]|nr:amidinotransferase [Flavobacteriales bacterium]